MSSFNKNSISKEEFDKITSSVDDFLKGIDIKFFNANFNILTELIDVFGDSDYEKVKYNIETLNSLNKKLEAVLVHIVKTHNKDFFKIISFVRQVFSDSEHFITKITEFSDFLSYLKTTNKFLTVSNTQNWKLKSLYFSRILNNMNKINNILRIIIDCEQFYYNNKLFNSILYLNKLLSEYDSFDKDFRKFDLLVSSNDRLRKLKSNIFSKLCELFDEYVLISNSTSLKPDFMNINYSAKDYENIKMSNKKINDDLINQVNQSYKYLIEKSFTEQTNYYSFSSFFKLLYITQSFEFSIIKNANKLDEKYSALKDKIFIDKKLASNNLSLDLFSNNRLNNLINFYNSFQIYSENIEILKLIEMSFFDKIIENFETTIEVSVELIKETCLTETLSDKDKFMLFIQEQFFFLYKVFINYYSFRNYLENNDNRFFLNKIMSKFQYVFSLPILIFAANNNIDFNPDELKKKSSITNEVFDFNFNQDIKDFIFPYLKKNSLEVKIRENPYSDYSLWPIITKLSWNFYVFIRKQGFNIELERFKEVVLVFNNYFSTKTRYEVISFSPNNRSVSYLSEVDIDSNNLKLINEFYTKLDNLKEMLFYSSKNSYVDILKSVFSLIFTINQEITRLLKYYKGRIFYDNIIADLKQEIKSTFLKKLIEPNFLDINKDKETETKKVNVDSKETIDNVTVCVDNNNSFEFENCSIYNERISRILYTGIPETNEKRLLFKSKLQIEFFLKLTANLENLINHIENVTKSILEKCFKGGTLRAFMNQYSSKFYKDMIKEKRSLIEKNPSSLPIVLDFDSPLIKSVSSNYFDFIVCLILNEVEEVNLQYFEMLLINKTELSFVLNSYFKQLRKRKFNLLEPQMFCDNYSSAFCKELKQAQSIFKGYLSNKAFTFVSCHLLCLFNTTSLKCLNILNNNSVNVIGSNLLKRNYEFVVNTCFKLNVSKEFENSIVIYPNYVKLLFLSNDELVLSIKSSMNKTTYSTSFIDSLLEIRYNILGSNYDKQTILNSIYS